MITTCVEDLDQKAGTRTVLGPKPSEGGFRGLKKENQKGPTYAGAQDTLRQAMNYITNQKNRKKFKIVVGMAQRWADNHL